MSVTILSENQTAIKNINTKTQKNTETSPSIHIHCEREKGTVLFLSASLYVSKRGAY